MFDTEALRAYLRHRALIRAEPHFFVSEGQAYWTVYLETRLMRGASNPVLDPPTVTSHTSTSHASVRRTADRAAFNRLLGELDEFERARYDRLLAWRRVEAYEEGAPQYVIFGNKEALAIARQAPRTIEALGQIPGVGRRRLQKHGHKILELLHGPNPNSAPVRSVDGDDEVVDAEDHAFSEAASPLIDEPSGGAGGRDHGEHHERELPEGQGEASPVDGGE